MYQKSPCRVIDCWSVFLQSTHYKLHRKKKGQGRVSFSFSNFHTLSILIDHFMIHCAFNVLANLAKYEPFAETAVFHNTLYFNWAGERRCRVQEMSADTREEDGRHPKDHQEAIYYCQQQEIVPIKKETKLLFNPDP